MYHARGQFSSYLLYSLYRRGMKKTVPGGTANRFQSVREYYLAGNLPGRNMVGNRRYSTIIYAPPFWFPTDSLNRFLLPSDITTIILASQAGTEPPSPVNPIIKRYVQYSVIRNRPAELAEIRARRCCPCSFRQLSETSSLVQVLLGSLYQFTEHFNLLRAGELF